MDDGNFGADAFFRHENVQYKAVFSRETTIMDRIQGWDDEDKRVGSKFAACMCIYTKKSVDKRTTTEPSNGGVFGEANVVHHAMHGLGLCWDFRGSRVGVRKHNFPACVRSDGHGTG